MWATTKEDNRIEPSTEENQEARAREVLRALDSGNDLLARTLLDQVAPYLAAMTLRKATTMSPTSRIAKFAEIYLHDNREAFERDVRDIEKAYAVLTRSTIQSASLSFGGRISKDGDGAKSLAASRIFQIDAPTLIEAGTAINEKAISSPYLVAPFPKFAIFPDEPISIPEITLEDGKTVSENNLKVTCFWVDATTSEWQCYARLESPSGTHDIVTRMDVAEGAIILRPDIREAMTDIVEDFRSSGISAKTMHVGGIGRITGSLVQRIEDERDAMHDNDSEEFLALPRIIAGFCILLNSRNVETPATHGARTDVRDEDINGDGPRKRRPRYRVVITKGIVEKHVRAVLRGGDNVRARRPHWVRKHTRTYRDGYVAVVRRHTRGGDPGFYLPIYELKHGRPPTVITP